MELDREELGALRDLVKIKDKQIEELQKQISNLERTVDIFKDNINLLEQSLEELTPPAGSAQVPPPPETI